MSPDVRDAPRRLLRWRPERSVVAVCLAMSVVGFSTTALGVASRGIADDLGVSVKTVSWIVGSFLLVAASFSLVGGRLGDLIGRARTFTIGAAVFALGAFVAAVSPTSSWLIVGRVIEGLGAALVVPASIELVAAYPPKSGAGEGFRLRGVVYAASFGIGPLVGGLLCDFLSWRAIFWLELAALLAVCVLALPLVRVASQLPKAPTHDVVGGALIVLIVLIGVIGAFRTRELGWLSWPTMLTLALVGLLVLLLLWVESRAKHPMLHPALLRNRIVLGANVATVAASLGMLGLIYFFNLFAQSAATFDRTSLAVAAALIPFMVSVLLFSYLSDALSRRLGTRGPVLLGLGMSIVGFAWLGATSGATTQAQLALPLVLCGIGAGIANAGLTRPAVLSERRKRIDEAAGLLSLSRFLGSALAIAVGTSTYLSVAVRLPAAEMAQSGQQVGDVAMGGSAYHRAVATLSADLRGPFEAATKSQTAEAFAQTMRLAAVMLFVLTVAAVWLLRPGTAMDGEDEELDREAGPGDAPSGQRAG